MKSEKQIQKWIDDFNKRAKRILAKKKPTYSDYSMLSFIMMCIKTLEWTLKDEKAKHGKKN